MPPLTPAERERLRKFQKKLLAPPSSDDDAASSVHSDEAHPPSSPRMSDALSTPLHGLPIEVLFPSLQPPTRLLRQMTRPEHLDQMVTVVPVFCSCVDSILKSVTCSSILLRTCVVYMLLHDAICSVSLKLDEHIGKLRSGNAPSTEEGMAGALKLVDRIIRYLLLLHRAAENLHRTTLKPLPDLPIEILEVDTSEQATTSAAVSDPEEASPTVDDADQTSLDSPVSDATESLNSPVTDATDKTLVSSETPASVQKTRTPKKKKNKFIRRLLQMPLELSTADTPKSLKRSTLPAVNPGASSSNNSSTALARSQSLGERLDQLIVRQSFFYDCADPLSPEKKVDMPLPTGNVVAIRLDSNGDVTAASLPALIMLLTSHHAFVVDDICETFFLSFRLFSSPSELLTVFQSRWDERPPDTQSPLTHAQQRVWDQHKRFVRNCLAHLILVWLDDYWRPEEDAPVLDRMQTFVKRFAAAGVVESAVSLIREAISRASQTEHAPRLQRVKEVERQGAPPAVPPFQMVLVQEEEYCVSINVFMSPAGRERFAGQITYLSHQLFRALDPEQAVARWVTGAPTFLELQRMEEELLFWVAQSILDGKSRGERVALIEFWLSVATICVDLRNFSSASAIFGGLVFSPVERLSLTILQIGIPSKQQYRRLNSLFDGGNNFAAYRRALAESNLPAVPLMAVLRKDIISANEIAGSVALTNDPAAEKTLINFGAFRMLKKVICTMEACLVSYKISPVTVIQDWIRAQVARFPQAEHATLSQQMDETSRKLETRAPDPIQKGQTWLQTVKGSVESGAFTLHALPDPGAVAAKPRSIATRMNFRTVPK